MNARRSASALTATAFAAVMFASSAALAFADDTNDRSVTVPSSSTETETFSNVPVTVSLSADGGETVFATSARTVGDMLAERGITLRSRDGVSYGLRTPLRDGMRIVVRRAVAFSLVDGRTTRRILSSAPTIAQALREANVRVRAHDVVRPARSSAVVADERVTLTHVTTWVATLHHVIAAPIVRRNDDTLLAGSYKTIAHGRAGERLVSVQYTLHGASVRSKVIAVRVARAAAPKIIARGTAPSRATLASFARAGFEGALHFAGTAIHMIATAYTAHCSGCSGMTASGKRAGFGVIAVDPRVTPLGTKLFVPGYGTAIAGDTGGSIVGHRIDLGMETVAQADGYGVRRVTVFILK